MKKCKIKVSKFTFGDPIIEVEGYLRQPGLFVHRIFRENTLWTVTHSLSGYSIPGARFLKRKQAFAFADGLVAILSNWDISQKKVCEIIDSDTNYIFQIRNLSSRIKKNDGKELLKLVYESSNAFNEEDNM